MTTACCPPAPLTGGAATKTGWLPLLTRAWALWRERNRLSATLRALEQLDERTRRDLGLAERGMPARADRLWDLERGSW